MEKKMTYAQALDVVIAKEDNEEVKARLVDLKATLAKRTAKRSEKKSAEQDAFKNEVLSALNLIGKAATVTELFATGVFAADVSPQKISAYLKKMVEVDGTVVKTVDKKKSYFSVAESKPTEEEVGEE